MVIVYNDFQTMLDIMKNNVRKTKESIHMLIQRVSETIQGGWNG